VVLFDDNASVIKEDRVLGGRAPGSFVVNEDKLDGVTVVGDRDARPTGHA